MDALNMATSLIWFYPIWLYRATLYPVSTAILNQFDGKVLTYQLKSGEINQYMVQKLGSLFRKFQNHSPSKGRSEQASSSSCTRAQNATCPSAKVAVPTIRRVAGPFHAPGRGSRQLSRLVVVFTQWDTFTRMVASSLDAGQILAFNNWPSVHPMSMSWHDIGCNEGKLLKASIWHRGQA